MYKLKNWTNFHSVIEKRGNWLISQPVLGEGWGVGYNRFGVQMERGLGTVAGFMVTEQRFEAS